MILNLSKFNDSDHFGNIKIWLIDQINEKLKQDYPRNTKCNILLSEACRLYSVELNIEINRKKSRRILRKFLSCDKISGDSLAYFIFIEGRATSRDSIKSVVKHLGNQAYQELLANPITNISGDEILTLALSKNFYQSREWKSVRYQAFRVYKNYCQCCGRKRGESVTLHADHVKPRSISPHLALDLTNIQILCEECNIGKSNVDCTDWRA